MFIPNHMNLKIIPFNVVDHTDLPEIRVDKMPVDGDPLEINNEMYFVCETKYDDKDGKQKIGVIPLVVRNPAKVENIENYLKCLSTAQRRIRYRKENKICDFNDCDEMVIT